MPIDQETITMLWSVLKQLNTSGINFDIVAADLGINKKHTAYCRWNAFVKAQTGGPKQDDGSPAPKVAKVTKPRATPAQRKRKPNANGMQVKKEGSDEGSEAAMGATESFLASLSPSKKRRFEELNGEAESVDGCTE